MVIKMPDVIIKIGADDTEAEDKLQAQIDKMDAAAIQLTEFQRNVLSTVSRAMGMINQSYSILKQFVQRAGSIIDPMFDALFQVLSSVVSTVVGAALLLSASLHPALVAIGLSLLVVSLELQIATQVELLESKGRIDALFANMLQDLTSSSPIRSLVGVSF